MPDLGLCAVVPERDSFEYGQVGVGSCLASPADLRVRIDPDDPENHFLFVVNSNSRGNFQGSSLLSIDASSIAMDCAENGMHELDTSALTMQEFAGRIDFYGASDLALVSNRHSGGFEGDLTDVVFTVDVSDPTELRFSDVGPSHWGPYRYITVPADPWSVRVDQERARAWVLGMTTHEVIALDLGDSPTDELEQVDLYGERSTSEPVFDDADGSGSDPDFELVAVRDEQVKNEQLQIRYMGGTTRLYYPVDVVSGSSGLVQADAGDDVTFSLLPGGVVLEGTAAWAEAGLGAAAVGRVGEALEALVTGQSAAGDFSIGMAQAANHALDWSLAAEPSLRADGADWSSGGLFDPDALLDEGEYRVVFAGGAGLGRGIGHARGASLEGLDFAGAEDLEAGLSGAVLLPEADSFDAVSVGSPALVRRGDTGEYLLWYSGHADASFDGSPGTVPSGLAIGLARSEDGIHFTRSDAGQDGSALVFGPGEAGAWDAQGVTAPSIYFDNGRFHLWYHGFDGNSWRIGRAVSIDGVEWSRDARNPIFAPQVSARVGAVPQRAFAYKATQGGYYRVEGTVSGPVTQYAFEGSVYESPLSPVNFEVVGGQALGRGTAGSVDADGVSSPSAVAGEVVFYSGHAGSARRLVSATDLGVGVQHGKAVRMQGFVGPLAGLNGNSPALAITGAEARSLVDGRVLVAFEAAGGLAMAVGEAATSKEEIVFEAAAGGTLVASVGAEEAFDVLGIEAPALLLDAPDGLQRLYYSGQGEQGWQIGLMTSSDGDSWTRVGEDGLVLGTGPAGSWDDFSVRSPTVLWDSQSSLFRMWYVGSDGEQTRIGHASSADGLSWQRHLDPSGVGTWVFDGAELPFVGGSALSPSVAVRGDGSLEMWFEGQLNGVARLGRARSDDGISWAAITNPTTAGDSFTLTTRSGDDVPGSGIHLGDDANSARFIDGFAVTGAGASEMVLSPDGRFAVVANKRSSFLIVLDLHDDSDADIGYIDSNFNDIEAVIRIPQVHGMVGTRDMVFSPSGEELYVLLSPLIQPGNPESGFGTEAFLRLDWTLVQDSDESVAIREGMITGYLPLARGVERDQGYSNDVSVGAGSMALSADGSRAYVLNFNDNSMYVLDLRAGARGAVIDIIDGLDENPWEVELSPDGRRAYVANSYGVSRGTAQHSTVQVIDVDETSDRYGQVLTRLTNVSSRAEAGCE